MAMICKAIVTCAVTVKTPIACVTALFFFAACSGDNGAESSSAKAWTMDFPAAKESAAEQGKDLFIEFTGSDWCPPCKQFDREVLSKKEFLAAAQEHFVLVKIDFPKNEKKLTPEIIQQNDDLYDRYHVPSFPTVVLADAVGMPYTLHEYDVIDVDAYVRKLEQMRGIRVKRDAALQSAEALNGVDKAKALYDALNLMELDFNLLSDFYGDTLDAIMANDPNDETGLAKSTAAYNRLIDFHDQINERAAADDFEGILPLIDEALKYDGFEPRDIQEITMTRAVILGQLGRFDEAIQAANDVAMIDPYSDLIPQLKSFKAEMMLARDDQAAKDD